MFFRSERNQLKLAQQEARKIFDKTGMKPRVLSTTNLSVFGGELRYSFRLVWEEKEIILFAILQWLVIGLAYMLWTGILDWIPDSIWEEVRRANERNDQNAFALINLVLFGWSFFIIIVVSYPLSLLSAAMIASHYLRHSNKASTIGSCFNLAFRHLGRLWIFTAIDAWITVRAILNRLPKKRGRKTTVGSEILYYAWKIGTLGVMPALVAGKGYIEATKDSIALLRHRPWRAIGIRMGYSLFCWIIGILAYIGAIYYFMAFGDFHTNEVNQIYNFYFLMTVPMVIAIGIVVVIIRPFFLVMVSKLYTDIIPVGQEVITPITPKFNLLAFFFGFLFIALFVIYFLGEPLGIHEWIEKLAAKEIELYRKE